MFGEHEEVLIPAILWCVIEVCDSLNPSMCVVRLSKMAASIYLFRAVERVKKSFWVPLGLKISAS